MSSSSSRSKALSQHGRDLLARAAQGVVANAPSIMNHNEILAKLSMSSGSKKTKEAKMWTEEEDLLLRRAIEKHGEDWPRVVEEVPGRNKLQCVQRWKKTLKPGLTKGPWKPEEDALLIQVMSEEMEGDWQAIARRVPGRNAKQCKERWTLNLNPSINHGPWTPEEDAALVQLHSEIGGKWSILAKRLTGRTEHSIKTRFLSLQRQAAKVRGWTVDEDRLILKHFMLAPGLDGTASATKALTGRTKKQVMQRWVHLREHYVSIDDLATSSSQGMVALTDQDLELLIPGTSMSASAYSGSTFSHNNSSDSLSDGLPSAEVYPEQMSNQQQQRVKSLARRHGSSTPSQPFRPLAKKLEKSHASSSSSTSNQYAGYQPSSSSAANKAAIGGELLNAAYGSSLLEPLSSILQSQGSSSTLMMDGNTSTTSGPTTDPFIAGLEKTLGRPSLSSTENKFPSIDSSIAEMDFSMPLKSNLQLDVNRMQAQAPTLVSPSTIVSPSATEPQRTLRSSAFSSFILPPITSGGGPPSPEPLSNRADSLLALVSELDQLSKTTPQSPSGGRRQRRFSSSSNASQPMMQPTRIAPQPQQQTTFEYTPRAEDMMRAFSSFAPEISGSYGYNSNNVGDNGYVQQQQQQQHQLPHHSSSSFLFGNAGMEFSRGLSNSDLNISLASSSSVGAVPNGTQLGNRTTSSTMYSPQIGVGEDDKTLRKFASSLGGLEAEMFESMFSSN